MNTTVTVQIGNSDDTLSQREWSRFVDDLREVLEDFSDKVHFSGGAPADAAWQNWCVVLEINTDSGQLGFTNAQILDGTLRDLRAELSDLALRYRQDSIAMTIGQTTLVKP